MPDARTLTVAIIEDERDVRDGLAALIHGTAGFRCTARFRTMEDALRDIGATPPDVILTDINLPGMSGVDGISVLRERFPDLPILALTVYDSDDKVFRALCAGASGYLLKTTPPSKLLESIRDVAEGGAPMSPEVARRVVRVFRTFRPAAGANYNLTPQESEALRLLAEGHQRKTAAQELGISINTFSFHLKHVYEKLQVHSKTEAVAKALRERLV